MAPGSAFSSKMSFQIWRVRLDMASADMDKYWHLAVNKAGAQLPAALKGN